MRLTLLAQRRVGGKRQFLVRWEDWTPEHDSWESEDNIFDETLIRQFEAAQSAALKLGMCTR